MSEWLSWSAMAAFTVLAAAVVTRPWWQQRASRVQVRQAANVAAYRTRLAELQAERAAGLVEATEAASLERELGGRLLADAADPAVIVQAAGAAPRRLAPVVVVLVALLAFAGGGYELGGSWRAQREIALAGRDPAGSVAPEVAAMIEQLARRLQAQPGDVQGWTMLGRSYFAMQRYADAARAYGEANVRRAAAGQPADADGLVGEGEALAFADGRSIPPPAAALFERALRLSPDSGKALWYGGLAAAQEGRLDDARGRWSRLVATAELPEPMRAAVQARLDAIGDSDPDPGTLPGDAEVARGDTVAAEPAVHLEVEVSLAPALAAHPRAGETLFVFAKAASGPPVPLAVQRLPDATLPAHVTLDDSMAMTPQLRLSQFGRYVVTARLSTDGGALPRPGDPEGSVEVDRAAAAAPITLRIDHLHTR